MDWKRWLIAIGGMAVLTAIVIAGQVRDTSNPQDTPEDRAPYAEVACEDFAHEAGMRTDDGETGNISSRNIIGVIYTVRMYDGDVRVGTCMVQATGPEEWTLVELASL